MAFKSNTFKVQPKRRSVAGQSAKTLQIRHKKAIDKVVADAKSLAEDRRRTLAEISDSKLRTSAAR